MYLEVVKNEEVVTEKTNLPYIRTTFRPVKLIGDRTVMGSVLSGARIFNPGKQPNVGDVFEGKIIKFDTAPYPIGVGKDAKTVNTISCVVMADENGETIANDQLKRHSASIMKNGKPMIDYVALAKEEAKKIANAKKGNKKLVVEGEEDQEGAE